MLPQQRKMLPLFVAILVIALNVLRCPDLLLTPRFFAEEGATYFAAAFRSSLLANILTAHYGYYTLFNQLATSLAASVPLDHAPLVTTLLALSVQVGISCYLLWGDLPLLHTLTRRAVLALAVPLVAWPGHWLTVIGAQCWLGAGTFFLLLAGGSGRQPRRLLLRSGYLALAGLTGVVSCFMAPAYLWRAIRERSREYFAYTGILTLSVLVHAGVFLSALGHRSPELAGRFPDTPLFPMVGKTVVYQFAVPFTGRGGYEEPLCITAGIAIKTAVENLFGVNLLIHDLFVVPLLVGAAVILLTGFLLWQNRHGLEGQLIMLSLVTVTLLSNLCSINATGGPRYYFIPSLMLLTLFLCGRDAGRYRLVQALAGLLLVSTLLANGYEFRSIMRKQAYDPAYPDWRAELALWRMSPSHQIGIWPTPWTMNLVGEMPPRKPDRFAGVGAALPR